MSPIELKFLNALRSVVEKQNILLVDYTRYETIAAFNVDHWLIVTKEHEPDPDYYGDDADDNHSIEEWTVYGDVPLLTYRADFVIEAEYGRLVVECDGHDYHDRTKQQAAYDRARDRELLLTGLATVRYTGSEIHHAAERCAIEAIRIARVLSDKSFLEWQGRRRG